MNFEYLNVSVTQKLTKLQFFLYKQLLTAVNNIIIQMAENQCWWPCKTCLTKNYLDINFEYLNAAFGTVNCF